VLSRKELTMLERSKAWVLRLPLILLLLGIVIIFVLGVPRNSPAIACKHHRTSLASSERSYYKSRGQFLVGDAGVLRNLVTLGFSKGIETCPSGGVYSSELDSTGALRIHCSIRSHDVNANGSSGAMVSWSK
jgi:hypothetical protein